MKPSLFLKIFLSFWFVQAVVIGSVLLISRPPDGDMLAKTAMNVLAILGQNAVEAYERRGEVEINPLLTQAARPAQFQAILVGPDLRVLSLGNLSKSDRYVAAQALERYQPRFENGLQGSVVAVPLTGSGGRHYVLVSHFAMRLDHPAPPELIKTLSLAVLVSGLVCFWLARYLTAPVARLSAAAMELAAGNLSARAGLDLGYRRDEIAQLVGDFDKMAERIESLMDAQKQLISDMSHELRTPLTRLNLALELLRKAKCPEGAAAMDRLEREATRMSDMIARVLTLSRLEATSASGENRNVALADLVREIVNDTNFEALNRRCSIVLEEVDDCTVEGNPDLLRSALENVIRNAVRYTAEGTQVVVSLAHREQMQGPVATIQVRDWGPGVPDTALEHLFRPFYRLDEARERKTGGVGLGLAITQRAVSLHGGKVIATNARDGGLVIDIELPLQHSRARTN